MLHVIVPSTWLGGPDGELLVGAAVAAFWEVVAVGNADPVAPVSAVGVGAGGC
jgi:hypothetical protein